MTFLSTIFRSTEIAPVTQPVKIRQITLVDFHLEEAQKLFQTGDYQEALSTCEQALKLDDTCAAVYRLRGVIRYELQDYVGATQDLHRSLGLA